MLNFVVSTTKLLLADWQRFLIGGIIVISAIIAIEGILKIAMFDKIKNKTVKKVLLAFTSIVLVFPVTAIYFWLEKIAFTYYFYGVAVLSVLTVLSYWAYENTAFRNLVGFVGKKILLKVKNILDKAFTEDNVNVIQEIDKAYKDLKTETKNKVQSKSSDLKNL